ncbi:MAG TPA: dihydrolipoyl dehydrogenase [Anaerolineales bacterium]|nr:dihydrolipoyl dehydrogenase [Anaerolineales bacterium]
MNYDLIVIGAGPAGYVCAIRASQLGQKSAIIDKQWMGGVCLNVGCIPSKSLLKNAEVAETLRHRGKEFGFSFDNLKLDYGAAVKRSRQVSNRLVKGVEFLMKKNKIDVHIGAAELKSASTVEVTSKDGTKQTLTAKNIVVATGAQAGTPPGLALDGKKVVSYWEAILQETLPASVVVIGGGAIGVEFATVWNAYGADVTVVEMLPRIVPLEDEDVSKELAKEFTKKGIKVKSGTKFESIDTSGEKVKVTVSGSSGSETLEADQVLVATGFKPNSRGIGLEAVGVKTNQRGFVEIDDGMQTSVSGVWAIGDVTGKLLLAHVGSAQGIVCAETVAGHSTVTLDYDMMPRATYCQPQIASFGYTEAQAKEKGYEVKTAKFNFQANGKALGLGDHAGWVKIVTDAKYGEILGAHMIGPEVTELLPELTLAHNLELTAEEIAHNVHAHPTLSEVIMEAAHGLTGGYIHM